MQLVEKKTGYTPSAGRTLVTNASHNGLNLTAVTLNDGNEYVSHEMMYDYGFENYKKYTILDRKKFKIDNAYYPNKIYIKENFSYPLTDVEKENVKVLVKLTKLDKPNNNDEVGEVIVKLKTEEIFREKVYVKVKEEAKKRAFLKRCGRGYLINKLWAGFILVGICYSFFTGRVDVINKEIIECGETSLNLFLSMFPMMILWSGIMNIAKKSWYS